MEIILEQAKLIHPGHPQHGSRLNIRIRDGKIVSLKTGKDKNARTIKGKDLHVSIGWLDLGASVGEPGYEHRETVHSLTLAARDGGYTGVAVLPNTKPPLHSKAEIEFISRKSHAADIDIYPIGAISKGNQGKELAEMIDMHTSGAIAFSDGLFPVQDNGVMLRAMMYVNHFNGLIINNPEDLATASLGQMHEGIVSQQLGLKGIPSIAESLMLQRDLYLAGYARCRYLAHLVSTEESVKQFKVARKNLRSAFSSVSYLNLLLNDTSLNGFDSNFKQSPPLRTERDRKALIQGVKQKVIDLVCSNHRPLEVEKKDLEFAYADPGTIGLQTAYAALATESVLDPEEWVTAVAFNSRQVLKLALPEIAVGSAANLTIFDPEEEWEFGPDRLKSLSKNTPFAGRRFKGRVLATLHKNSAYLNN